MSAFANTESTRMATAANQVNNKLFPKNKNSFRERKKLQQTDGLQRKRRMQRKQGVLLCEKSN